MLLIFILWVFHLSLFFPSWRPVFSLHQVQLSFPVCSASTHPGASTHSSNWRWAEHSHHLRSWDAETSFVQLSISSCWSSVEFLNSYLLSHYLLNSIAWPEIFFSGKRRRFLTCLCELWGLLPICLLLGDRSRELHSCSSQLKYAMLFHSFLCSVDISSNSIASCFSY